MKRLLRDEQHEVVAVSGASGGAICAFLAWYALLENDGARAADKAAELLDAFWRDNSADDPSSKFWNDWMLWTIRLQSNLPELAVSPYDLPLSSWIKGQLRMMLEKQRVDFGNLAERVGPSSPVLLVGAIDVISGFATNFDSREGGISVDALLASSAAPPVFKAAHVDGGVYWDALFCQNPPLRESGKRIRLSTSYRLSVVSSRIPYEPRADWRGGLRTLTPTPKNKASATMTSSPPGT